MQEGWFGTIYEEARTGCRKGGSEQSMRGLGRIAGKVVWKNLGGVWYRLQTEWFGRFYEIMNFIITMRKSDNSIGSNLTFWIRIKISR